jgi:hypothetical protein
MTSLTELKVLIREHNITIKGKRYGELIDEYNKKAKIPIPAKASLRDLKAQAKDLGITLTFKDDFDGKRKDKSKNKLIDDIDRVLGEKEEN